MLDLARTTSTEGESNFEVGFRQMEPSNILLFWIGVVLQLAGFGLQWRRVERVASEIEDLKHQELTGNLFVKEPTFSRGDIDGGDRPAEGQLATHDIQITEIREALVSTRAEIREWIATTAQESDQRSQHRIDRVVNLHRDTRAVEALILFIVGLTLSSSAAIA